MLSYEQRAVQFRISCSMRHELCPMQRLHRFHAWSSAKERQSHLLCWLHTQSQKLLHKKKLQTTNPPWYQKRLRMWFDALRKTKPPWQSLPRTLRNEHGWKPKNVENRRNGRISEGPDKEVSMPKLRRRGLCTRRKMLRLRLYQKVCVNMSSLLHRKVFVFDFS